MLNGKIAEYEQGFWKSIISHQVNPGENIPVGWSSIFSDTMDLFLQCDFDHSKLQEFYQKVELNYHNFINNPKFKERYKATQLPISEDLFCHLFAYTGVFYKIFNRNHENLFLNRINHYNTGKPALLSTMLEKGLYMCAEQALLAHHYLNIHGIKNIYIWGELLRDFTPKTENSGEAHSFIYLKDKHTSLIYDPTLPNKWEKSIFPKIQKMSDDTNFLYLFATKEKRFIEVQDLCTDSKYYYGFWDGTYILEKDLVPSLMDNKSI